MGAGSFLLDLSCKCDQARPSNLQNRPRWRIIRLNVRSPRRGGNGRGRTLLTTARRSNTLINKLPIEVAPGLSVSGQALAYSTLPRVHPSGVLLERLRDAGGVSLEDLFNLIKKNSSADSDEKFISIISGNLVDARSKTSKTNFSVVK